MALLNYSNNINGVENEEATALMWLLLSQLYNDRPDYLGLKALLSDCLNEAELDVNDYKSKYKRLYNSDHDWLYEKIQSTTSLNDERSILFIKSSICRLYDWFLLSDKELSNQEEVIPPVLDTSIQIYKDYSNKDDFIKQWNKNKPFIDSYLGKMSNIDLPELMKKADRQFLQLLGHRILNIRRKINSRVRKQDLFSRTTNKSAGFYRDFEVNVNSYIENIFKYPSNLLYNYYIKHREDRYDYIPLDKNYDFIRFNTIKNKAKSTRHVFYTNPQVNSFLKPLNDIFESELRGIKYIGTYNQDRAIKDMMKTVTNNIDRDISILCLDASKYSDTLPISLINYVLNLIIQDKHLTKAICECLNLPVLYKGKLCSHNATLQGVYFDFTAITLVNLYVQCAISSYLGKRIIMTNVVGDDSYLIIDGKNHKEYSEVGRIIWANFGCVVKEEKKTSSNLEEGFITYLKYYSETKDREIINLSGISPGLWLKNVHSYARLTSIISYLKKSLYISRDYIPDSLLRDYIHYFKDIIYRAQMTKILRVSRDDADFIYNNALSLLLERPFLFGGFKYYDLNKIEDRQGIINEIEDGLRYMEYNFIDKNQTILGTLEWLKQSYELKSTCLDNDINLFISEEFNEIYSKLIRFKKRSNEFIDFGQDDILEIRSLLRSLTDKKFDKYIPGGLTTDRVTQQPFEDKMLLSPKLSAINLDSLIYLPMSHSIEEKNANILALKLIGKDWKIIRDSYSNSGTKFIDINSSLTITLSGITRGKYVTVEDWIVRSENMRNYEKDLWEEEISIVANGIYELNPDKQTLDFLSIDYHNIYRVLSAISFACRNKISRDSKLKELINDYINEYVRDYSGRLAKEYINKWIESQ